MTESQTTGADEGPVEAMRNAMYGVVRTGEVHAAEEVVERLRERGYVLGKVSTEE